MSAEREMSLDEYVAVLRGAHRAIKELAALRAENARLRAVLNRCHEAVGENADSDDETLPEGIELRIKQMLARIAEDEAELARLRAVILRTHETYCTPPCVRCDYGNTGRCEPDCLRCAGTGVDNRFARTGRHAPECLSFEVEL
jgi:hypothetical protein